MKALVLLFALVLLPAVPVAAGSVTPVGNVERGTMVTLKGAIDRISIRMSSGCPMRRAASGVMSVQTGYWPPSEKRFGSPDSSTVTSVASSCMHAA